MLSRQVRHFRAKNSLSDADHDKTLGLDYSAMEGRIELKFSGFFLKVLGYPTVLKSTRFVTHDLYPLRSLASCGG